MSSEEDKPPAPPVRLTSNRGGSDRLDGPPDSKPLPKGKFQFYADELTDLLTFYQQSPTIRIAKRKR